MLISLMSILESGDVHLQLIMLVLMIHVYHYALIQCMVILQQAIVKCVFIAVQLAATHSIALHVVLEIIEQLIQVYYVLAIQHIMMMELMLFVEIVV